MATAEKYDRQLRLWGAEGQRLLARASVCALGCTPSLTETLKNLILPGCGRVVIVDDALVTQEDADTNFFITSPSVGQLRAPVAAAALAELNPDVKVESLVSSLESTLATNAAWFTQFQLVIAARHSLPELAAVYKVLESANIPLMIVDAYGLIGYVRISSKECCVVESRCTATEDLRVGDPFPALRTWVDSFDLADAERMKRVRIPSLVLLIKVLDAWKTEHAGAVPKSFAEKKEFKARLHALREDDDFSNVDEAVTTASLAFLSAPCSDEVAAILASPQADALSADCNPYWIVVAALREFMAETGHLPLSGSVHDMTTTTESYLACQRLYAAAAAADLESVTQRVAALCAKHHIAADHVSNDLIRRMCRFACALRVVPQHSILEEMELDTHTQRTIATELSTACSLVEMGLQQPGVCPMAWYLALRAANEFRASHGRAPGAGAHVSLEADADEVWALMQSYLTTASVPAAAADVIPRTVATEITRYGGCEPHTIAAYVGGVASQEALKLITGLFVPIGNTHVFNGIAAVGAMYLL